MLNNEPQINFDSIRTKSPSKHRQLLIALSLLMAALVVVVLKNRDFWSDVIGLEAMTEQAAISPASTVTKGERRGASQSKKPGVKSSISTAAETPSTNLRAAEPSPLQVDVTYSSGRRQTLLASNAAVLIFPQQNPTGPVVPSAGAAVMGENQTLGGVQVRFSGQMIRVLGKPAAPVYPLSAQRANVQGSVVLQARITPDGQVDALQVISGPPMLTSAAMEAVKQWKFKPHYEAGKAVATETFITVNFAISAE